MIVAKLANAAGRSMDYRPLRKSLHIRPDEMRVALDWLADFAPPVITVAAVEVPKGNGAIQKKTVITLLRHLP